MVVPSASKEALEVLRLMLKVSPQKRPTAKGLLAMPFFNKKPEIQKVLPATRKQIN